MHPLYVKDFISALTLISFHTLSFIVVLRLVGLGTLRINLIHGIACWCDCKSRVKHNRILNNEYPGFEHRHAGASHEKY
jgi:hypothetical protein